VVGGTEVGEEARRPGMATSHGAVLPEGLGAYGSEQPCPVRDDFRRTAVTMPER